MEIAVKTKEILVIGAGIAGCAVALALAKRGIAVTIITSPLDQRFYHASFIKHETLEEKIIELQREKQEQLNCSRAYEQLAISARKSIDELLEAHYLVDQCRNIDIHRCLQEQLAQFANVEWLVNHSIIELLTLDQHSLKQADCYKKPACIGVNVYNLEAQTNEYFLAKETILATGGATSLFRYSTHFSTACGEGIALACRAGARLLNMDQAQFHPLGLFEIGRPCFPLPLELLQEGGKILSFKTDSIEVDSSAQGLSTKLFDKLLKTHSEHLWLDLTFLESEVLKEKFPLVANYCLSRGFNIAKDLLPVVPVASYFCGGIAVDRVAQTSVQRLRAIGGVACTGLFWNSKDETLGVLESLTWAVACAEDLAKQAAKLVYYYPNLKEEPSQLENCNSPLEEDRQLLRQIMWSYIGIKQIPDHLERGSALLDQLYLANTSQNLSLCSIEQIQLIYAIQTARIIAHAACARHRINKRHTYLKEV